MSLSLISLSSSVCKLQLQSAYDGDGKVSQVPGTRPRVHGALRIPALGPSGASRDHIGIEHHEGQTAVAFLRVFVVKIDDGLLFPIFEPPIAWNPAVVLVDLAVPLPSVVKLALSDAQPGDKLLGWDLRPIRPITGVVDDLIMSVVGSPGSSQSSPSSFLSLTCSSMSSATTSFLR